MRLLLDMDGPLADFDAHGFQLCLERGYSFEVEGVHAQTARYFTEHMTVAEEIKAVRQMIESPGWFEQLPITPGAIEGVQRMIEHGIDVWVCTKPLERNPTCRDAKGAWLRSHLPMLEDKLIIAPDKSMIVGDILLDDAPKPSWFPDAQWQPVIFNAPFNGVGSEWEHLPHWTWSDPIEKLTEIARAWGY